jgi:hypothetical protein
LLTNFLLHQFVHVLQVAVHIFPPAKTMGYSMHYNGQLLAVHDAWLRSLHSTEWFGSLDLDEYLVVPPDAHDLGMYLGHVRESTGKIGVTFGMQYYDWTYGDLEAAAAEPTGMPSHIYSGRNSHWLAKSTRQLLEARVLMATRAT